MQRLILNTNFCFYKKPSVSIDYYIHFQKHTSTISPMAHIYCSLEEELFYKKLFETAERNEKEFSCPKMKLSNTERI